VWFVVTAVCGVLIAVPYRVVVLMRNTQPVTNP